MGWRGALRSLSAANNAAQREQKKRLNAAARAHGQIDRLIGQVERELEGEVAKVAELENKIRLKPLSASGMTFDPSTGRFNLKKIGDDKGKIIWEAQVGFDSDPATWTPGVVDGARGYQPIAITTTRLGVFVAFMVSQIAEGPKATKLFSKTDASKNAVFLNVNGHRYQAIEGQLDLPLFGPAPAIALVGFPLPNLVFQAASIDFHFKAGPARIAIGFADPNIFLQPLTGQSLADQVRAMLEEQYHPARQQAEQLKAQIAAKAKSSGCLIIVAAPFAMAAIYETILNWISAILRA